MDYQFVDFVEVRVGLITSGRFRRAVLWLAHAVVGTSGRVSPWALTAISLRDILANQLAPAPALPQMPGDRLRACRSRDRQDGLCRQRFS
jgi:hypothetical protein